MMWELIDPSGGSVALTGAEMSIGRDPANAIHVDDERASRRHATLRAVDGGWELNDAGSSNGTRVNGQPIGGPVRLTAGDRVGIGSTEFTVRAPAPDPGATVIGAPPAASAAPATPPAPKAGAPAASSTPGDLTERLLQSAVWTDNDLNDAGIPIVDRPIVSVGGGLGSLAVVDYLRIAGVSTEHIAVLTPNTEPSETYEFLAGNSQIPIHERLRSDSGSVMDNIWGFPSYALREAWADKSFAPLWQVTTEPILAEYYTPRSGQVYESVRRETARIGWQNMTHRGQVRMVRRRTGGGYFSVLTPPPGTSATRRVAFRSRFVHLALGYPGVRFLPDLREYRERTGDHRRVVNSYEPHDHVYSELARQPGVVLVRGSGIVASRVLQRLLDDNEAGRTRTTIVHLFRNYVDGPQGDSATFRRPGGDGFAYQAFNYPKAAWGGQFREKLFELQGEERSAFIDTTGGTNTAPRQDWTDQLQRSAASGTYVQRIGSVQSVDQISDGQMIRTVIRDREGAEQVIDADFIVDATGLEASIRANRVLADLVDVTGAGTNPKGRLEVEQSFEVVGTRAEPGRLYASGSSTLGGIYAPVDSFLGLQYAAQQIADDIAAAGGAPRLGTMRSFTEWVRWMRNQEPAA